MLSKSMQYSLIICNYGADDNDTDAVDDDEDDDEGEDDAVENTSGKYRINPTSPLCGDPLSRQSF